MACSGQRQRGRSGGGGGEKRRLKTPLHNFKLPSLRHPRRIKLPDQGLGSPPAPDCPGIEASGEADWGLDSWSSSSEESGVKRWNLRSRRSPRGGRNILAAKKGGEEKLMVELTRKEIEDDLMVFLGRRPILRPKKRPKNVQLYLDVLFPGLWLTKITLDSYK